MRKGGGVALAYKDESELGYREDGLGGIEIGQSPPSQEALFSNRDT